jgi:ADP-heptose:LPS heptosyltransferase
MNIATLRKIGILWGGGLGDLLVIRPLLQVLEVDENIETYFFTTANHSPQIFNDFFQSVKVIFLPQKLGELLPLIWCWRGFFDLLYLGPYPTLKTRLLATFLSSSELWNKHHKEISPFICEQVIADAKIFCASDLPGGDNLKSYLPWSCSVDTLREKFLLGISLPYVVVHVTAKDKWHTTQWPYVKWRFLLEKILLETTLGVVIVGVKSEEGHVAKIVSSFDQCFHSRLKLCLSLPLRETVKIIANSQCVICHNSGILHLATFLQKETLCITGSSALFWRPPYPWVTNITSDACRFACNSYKCPIPFFNAKCIKSITVDKVWNVLIRKIYQFRA